MLTALSSLTMLRPWALTHPTSLRVSKNNLADDSQSCSRESALYTRNSSRTSSKLGFIGGSLGPFFFRGLSPLSNRPSKTPPDSDGTTSVVPKSFCLVLVLLYAPGFTPCFAAGFTPCFAAIFEVKPAAKTHSPSTLSGKQYKGSFCLRDPLLYPIKPFITSLSLPAINVFSDIAISATARGLERENGLVHPSLLQISSNLKYIVASAGVNPFISTSCQYRLINSK